MRWTSNGDTNLVNGLDDPIDTRIVANGLVLWIDEDDFKILVGRVLVDPVRVQHPQIGAAATNSLFGGGTERALVFELVDSLVRWFSCHHGSSISESARSQIAAGMTKNEP